MPARANRAVWGRPPGARHPIGAASAQHTGPLGSDTPAPSVRSLLVTSASVCPGLRGSAHTDPPGPPHQPTGQVQRRERVLLKG